MAKKRKTKPWLFAILVLVVIFMGFYSVFYSDYNLVLTPEDAECPLVFGDLECFEGNYVIPFHNPGKRTLSNIEIHVPKTNGVDIYNVDEPLLRNTTETLILHTTSCDNVLRTEDLKIRWCCGEKCFESLFSEPGGNFTLEPTNTINNETYPTYPELSDCLPLQTYVREFCFDDLAETKNDITYCDYIKDEDVRNHCVGRISLNNDICNQISDSGLREGCTESIRLKEEWSGK